MIWLQVKSAIPSTRFDLIANASDETNREYIELIGTPGASLAGYYFVIFEGE